MVQTVPKRAVYYVLNVKFCDDIILNRDNGHEFVVPWQEDKTCHFFVRA